MSPDDRDTCSRQRTLPPHPSVHLSPISAGHGVTRGSRALSTQTQLLQTFMCFCAGGVGVERSNYR